jgi:phage-related minor tail protein
MADEMSHQDRQDLEQFRDTERKRERERQIKAQAATGPFKSWQQREIEELDLFEGQWKRGMVRKTY